WALLFPTASAAGPRKVKSADFVDFPVLVAIGAATNPLPLSALTAVKSALSDAYYEGMYTALARELDPCSGPTAEMLYGVYLLGAYLDSNDPAKGHALEEYYRLVSKAPHARPREAALTKNAQLIDEKIGKPTSSPPAAAASGRSAKSDRC